LILFAIHQSAIKYYHSPISGGRHGGLESVVTLSESLVTLSKKSLKWLDRMIRPLYNGGMKALFLTERNDEKQHSASFAERLRATILRVEQEIAEGYEHEAEYLERLREVLAEEEAMAKG
jgi:hypothetical protein